VIREALEEAIAILSVVPDIKEPPEAARRTNLELDHDTKGLTGMPDVAASILEKIAQASVFIGDVTPVGSTPKEVDGKSKPMMNPNVAIEMGFALGKLTSARVLAVLNSAFGDPDGLPFDIKHKRWPITYSLGPDVTKKEIYINSAPGIRYGNKDGVMFV
jgi:hypothetical protein